jgi:hypothetical protein
MILCGVKALSASKLDHEGLDFKEKGVNCTGLQGEPKL